MIDIAIIYPPFLRSVPPSGPAKLKAFVELHGFACKVIDWNIKFKLEVNDDKFWHRGYTFEDENDVETEMFIRNRVNEIKDIGVKYIGLSAYAYTKNFLFTVKTLRIIREILPDVKIIMGGHMAEIKNSGKILKSMDLIDYYVCGEGEYAILNILQGNTDYGGINGKPPVQISNLNELPFPDYSDYDLKEYPKNFLYVETSRGCIFNCSFCRRLTPKYRFKSAENVIAEIKDKYKKYGTYHLKFEDAVFNGNPKLLRNICNKIIELNKKKELPKLVWSSFINILPKTVMTEQMFSLMKEAGCVSVAFGVESGSQKLRKDMKKFIYDADIDHTIKYCHKISINLDISLLVGYPTETKKDFQKTLDFVSRYKEFSSGINLLLGSTYILTEETEIYNKQDEMGITIDEHERWIYKDNTFPSRYGRWIRLRNLAKECGYQIDDKNYENLRESYELYR